MTLLARSLIALVACSLRRQLLSRKTLLCALLLGMLACVVQVAGILHPWRPLEFTQFVILRVFGLFFLPVVALVYGTGALGDDRDEKTLVYLVTRPLPRWGIYVGKLVAVLPMCLIFTVGGLWLLERVAFFRGTQEAGGVFGTCATAILLSSLAYLAFFHLLGAVFRHSTMIALAYVFLIEVFVGRLPGILKRVSLSFYTWSMIFDAGASRGVAPFPNMIFRPVTGETAGIVLLSLTVVLVALGAVLFARRDYGEAS